MSELICFVTGIFIGVTGVGSAVMFFKWRPIIREYQKPVEVSEETKRKTPEQQLLDMLAWNPGRAGNE